MKTLTEVLREAKGLGVECAERTFWKYHQDRLIPPGRKISGKGKLVYFPDDTARRLWLIHILTKTLGLNLADVSRLPWSQFHMSQEVRPVNEIPAELLLEAKAKFDEAKDAALLKLIDQLMEQPERIKSDQGHTWSGQKTLEYS